MTVPTTIDAAAWLSKHLEGDDVEAGLVRSMRRVRGGVDVGPGVDAVQRRVRRTDRGAGELPQRVSDPAVGHAGRGPSPLRVCAGAGRRAAAADGATAAEACDVERVTMMADIVTVFMNSAR